MNQRTASALTFTGTVAAATIAAAFLSSNAYAEGPIVDKTDFVSTRSRAEVQAELMSRPGQVSAAATEWALQQNQPGQFQSTYSAEQARAAYKAARNEVRMLTGEDSGSSYFAQLRHSGGATAATIVARSAQ